MKMDKKRNILVLYHENTVMRFPEHYKLPFFRDLPELGYCVRFVGFRSDIAENLYEDDQVFIPKLKSKSVFGIPSEILKTRGNLRKALDSFVRQGFSPEIIISFNNPILIGFGNITAKRYGADHYIHIGHLMAETLLASDSFISRIRGFLAKSVRKRQISKAKQVWAMSEQMKKYLSAEFPAEKLKSWPSAVSASEDPSVYDTKAEELRRCLGIREEEKIIVYIGTLAKARGLEFVLLSLKKLAEKIPDVRLLMVGYANNSKDRDFLISYASEIGVEKNVIFHPPVDELELPYYIRLANAAISPFKPTEVFVNNSPLKLMEYFKAGTPVAATDIPDQRYVIDSSGGGLITQWDTDEFSIALENLLSMSRQQQLDMGRKGYLWVKENREIQKLSMEVDKWLQERY